MSDVEAKQVSDQQPEASKFGGMMRPIIGTCLAISALAFMALSGSSHASVQKSAASPMQLEVVKQGQQPILAGCANIYGSDPEQIFIDPDTGLRVLTAVFVICDDRSLNGVALDSLGFNPKTDIDKGVTYVETGAGCWLTLYDGMNFGGKSVVISPLTSMHLKHVVARNWNDLTRSLTTRSTTGSGVALYLAHRVALGSVNDHCAALYNDNPDTNQNADGLYLCGDSNRATTWSFDLQDIVDQGFNIQGDHFGIEYIQTGRRIKLTAFDSPKAGSQTIGSPLVLEGHQYLDLNTVKLGTEGAHWASNALSFSIVELHGGKPDTPAASFVDQAATPHN